MQGLFLLLISLSDSLYTSSYRTLQGTLIVHGFVMFLFRDENRGEELQNLVMSVSIDPNIVGSKFVVTLDLSESHL